ncbi:MerR family transcriptional regulator [Nonomuraea gerenzanensis]|uniref:Transcriptional regulator, MerR family n=1 Tax=Nonomuraea gerenzanensis TaxID=93944 RepID=A0A1M4EAL5_9ACTN|nr:MerR family transcriptional regulator [Nonomuraea gerenzanensis]UBU17958.1 MerR family transcriptional regulator [Nonomuraea gerenzanensis]SBO95758.1 transcriptional regulator, MerR family [Nonomuraea gerenzanensis]
MRIGELARRAGVSVRALRYYEEQKLLVPARSANGYRDYDEQAVAVVGRIRLLYAAGLASAAVAELLPAACGDARGVTVPGELTGELEQARARLVGEIRQRQASLDVLERLLASACYADARSSG